MTTSNDFYKTTTNKRRSIVEMTSSQARKFLLEQESYCNISLPSYFSFEALLQDVANFLKGKALSDHPKADQLVNHRLLNNKDGLYGWRPLELIHPAIYVSLVNQITEDSGWTTILERLHEFQSIDNIHCLSLPGKSLTPKSDTAEQISHWREQIEQKSVALSLEYEFLARTDVTDCYGSIYTHSIPWALHTKEVAKANRSDYDLIGNVIDKHIRCLQQGQTNGIPQGSALMDFMAELVLGYADSELSKALKNKTDFQFKILRYRDDYRIFVHTKRDGETILKQLTEVLIDLGLRLNRTKTYISDEVVQSSIRDDRLDWILRNNSDHNLQTQLLIIHDHCKAFPNSGTAVSALTEYYKRICDESSGIPNELLQLVSITVDIAFRNPKTYRVCAAILSNLVNYFETKEEKIRIVDGIRNKFSRIPNTGYLDIWLQTVSHKFGGDVDINEALCQLVRGENCHIWNNEWISAPGLVKAMDLSKIVDRDRLNDMDPFVPPDEVELFADAY